MIDTTIVIPAYGSLPLLRQCIESIMEYTDLTKIKVIVVCNGCDQDCKKYLSFRTFVKTVWFDEALGYPKAVNEGLKLVDTPYVILLNTDIILLEQVQHTWVNTLLSPLKENDNVVIAGFSCIWMHFQPFFPFCHAALRMCAVKELGYLDETFSPGYGEDADFCFKAILAGYEGVLVGNKFRITKNNNTTPIYHQGQGSFGGETNYLSDRAYGILKERYNKKLFDSIAS